jgi:hypothetical protein
MTCFRVLSIVTLGLVASAGCSSSKDSTDGGDNTDAQVSTDAGTTSDGGDSTDAQVSTEAEATLDGASIDGASTDAGSSDESDASSALTVLDLDDVKTNPTTYEWFDFKPNVKKLILAGAAETQHIAILWYTITEGGVALHYHAKTESVYVIDGTQTDDKGVYPTGTVYFNPPGSGHQVTHSSGFFQLAYAAPPDFANTSLIGAYTPVRIDTTVPDLTSVYPFEEKATGVKVFAPPLDASGGLRAELIQTTSSADYAYNGNYVLVLKGTCEVGGMPLGEHKVVVAKALEPQVFKVAAPQGGACLAMGISF